MAPLVGPLQPLRVGVDPFHAHLLPPATSRLVAEPHLAFWPAADAVRQLKAGHLAAVLLHLGWDGRPQRAAGAASPLGHRRLEPLPR